MFFARLPEQAGNGGKPEEHDSTDLKGPRTLLRIRPEIFVFEPDLGLKLGQTQPKIPGTVPTNRHTTIPNDSGPISACFDGDPKLLNCEIAQARPVRLFCACRLCRRPAGLL